MRFRAWVLSLSVMCCFHLSLADIHGFSNQMVYEWLYIKEGMNAVSPVYPVPGERSIVKLDLTIPPPEHKLQMQHQLHVYVFHADFLSAVGYESEGKKFFCCSPDITSKMGIQCEVGQVVVSPEVRNQTESENFFHGSVVLRQDAVVHYNTKYNVSQDGVYYVLFANCEMVLDNVAVQFNGTVEWLSPYGFLPGRLYPLLPFFGLMSLMYIVLALIWIVLAAMHWRELLYMQYCISGLIWLGMLEMGVWYFDFSAYNASGTRPEAVTLVAISLHVAKKAVSRMLVLLVCMGHSTVRPSVGKVKYKVFALTLVYIGVGLVSEFETQLKDATSVTLFNRMMFILPLTGIDTCFVIWSATSLVDTMKGLSLHRQLVKLSLYKWFARTLAACVFISVLFIAFQLLQAMKHDFDQHWKMLWIFDAFWHSLYFLVLMVVAMLWAPSANSKLYAYADELGTGGNEDDDLEDLADLELELDGVPMDSMDGENRPEHEL